MRLINSVKWVLVLVVILASIQLGLSLKCYLCLSLENELCADSFNENWLKIECKGNTVCVKTILKIEALKLYARDCMAPETCNEEWVQSCKTCTTDYCNTGLID